MTRHGVGRFAILLVALATTSCSSDQASTPPSSDAVPVSSASSSSLARPVPSTDPDAPGTDATTASEPEQSAPEQTPSDDSSASAPPATTAANQDAATVGVVVSGVGVSVVRRNGDVEPVSVAEASLRLTTPTFTEYQLMNDVSASDGYPMVLVDDQGQVGPAGRRYLLSNARLYETGVLDMGPGAQPAGTPGGRTGSADPSAEDSVIAALRAVPGVVDVERVAPGVLRVAIEP